MAQTRAPVKRVLETSSPSASPTSIWRLFTFYSATIALTMADLTWDELADIIDKFPERALEVGADALTKIAYDILAASQEVVPFDTGALYDSGEVSEPYGDLESVSVDIGYGSGEVQYAIIQHENMEYKHPNGGQAKYLEQPAMEAADSFEADLAPFFEDIFST